MYGTFSYVSVTPQKNSVSYRYRSFHSQRKMAQWCSEICPCQSLSKGPRAPIFSPWQKLQLLSRQFSQLLFYSFGFKLEPIINFHLFHHFWGGKKILKSYELINFAKERCWIIENDVCFKNLLINVLKIQQVYIEYPLC